MLRASNLQMEKCAFHSAWGRAFAAQGVWRMSVNGFVLSLLDCLQIAKACNTCPAVVSPLPRGFADHHFRAHSQNRGTWLSHRKSIAHMDQGWPVPRGGEPTRKVVGFHVEGASPSPRPHEARGVGGGSPSPVIIPPAFQVCVACRWSRLTRCPSFAGGLRRARSSLTARAVRFLSYAAGAGRNSAAAIHRRRAAGAAACLTSRARRRGCRPERSRTGGSRRWRCGQPQAARRGPRLWLRPRCHEPPRISGHAGA